MVLESSVLTTTIAPIIGMIVANFLFLGPMIEVLEVRKKKDMGKLNPIVFVFMLGNCYGYTVYGYMLRDPYLLFANFFGVLLAIFYLLTSVRLIKCHKFSARIEIATLLMLFLWSLYFVIIRFLPSKNWDTYVKITGYASLVVSCFLWASPLTTIHSVFKEKDSASINRGFLLGTLVSCTSWAVYGFALGDPVIYSGNTFGVIIAIIQILLVCRFPRKSSGKFLGGVSSENNRNVEGTPSSGRHISSTFETPTTGERSFSLTVT